VRAPVTQLVGPTVYPTIGIDPGQRWTGIAVRINDRCLDAVTLARPEGQENDDTSRYEADRSFAGQVLDMVDLLLDRHHDAGVGAASDWEASWDTTPWRVAIEGVRTAQPYMAGRKVHYTRNVMWAITQLAVIYGAVIGHFPHAVVVRPAHFDELHLPKYGGTGTKADTYPKELLRLRPRWFGPNEHPRGERRHEQAAWAIAGAAQLVKPLTLRTGGHG
jgi:hypothetical protein